MHKLRDFKTSISRRKFLEKETGVSLKNTSKTTIDEKIITGRNIENFIGATQIPLGVAGPLLITSDKLLVTSYYIPLATTEGALVASISRGCKAITESGGAKIEVENVGISRGPVFKTSGINKSQEVKIWIKENFAKLAKAAEATSSHLKLLKVETNSVGRNLFVRFSYDTGDAMGMNMATFATEALVKLIEEKTGIECIALAGNYDLDKKPSWLNFISGRGKKVWAEATLSPEIVKDILKTTPEKIVEVVTRKTQTGSIMSGSLGFNSHFANIAAAIFAATGQDLAHVVEASLGITSAESLEDGSLYFSIYLPSLQVGTVGGGTALPTQKEALNLMKINGVLEYSQVVAGAILAGELSLIASLAENSLACAHKKLGRKGK